MVAIAYRTNSLIRWQTSSLKVYQYYAKAKSTSYSFSLHGIKYGVTLRTYADP